jgi:uncharacterized lipoprotein YajG
VSVRCLFISCSAVLLLLIGGCSTNNVSLDYKPSTKIVLIAQAKTVTLGPFVDQRGETATWFGAIRGGYGNPLKKLEADPSVAELVKNAFREGLKARGIGSSGNAAYQIAGTIRKFDCSQYVRREAHAEIELHVLELSTGRQIFSQTYTADELEGSLLTLKAGVFASVEDLRAVAEKTLTEVVDKALDDSALRSVLQAS